MPATKLDALGRMQAGQTGYAVFAMSERGEIRPEGGEKARFNTRQEAEVERKRLEVELGLRKPEPDPE
jgi:hypothetical protein